MSFASPLGLLALFAVPAILAIHLYRRRLQERRVAGLFLFAPDAMTAAPGRVRSRLLRSPSLWLELAAAALLALWLGGLSFGVSSTPEHLVLVLDDTASMSAVVGPESAAQRARARAREIADDLSGSSVVTVITSGERPRIVLGPQAPLPHLADTLEVWEPTQRFHPLDPALSLGRDLGGSHLVLITDRPVETTDDYRMVAVGRAAPNAAIAGARRQRVDESTEEIRAEIVAYAANPLPRTVTVHAGDRQISSQSFTIEPGRASRLRISVPRTEYPLTVRIEDDALAADNHATLLPPRRRPIRVGSLLSEETTTSLRIARIIEALPDTHAAPDPLQAHVRFAAAAGDLARGATEIVIPQDAATSHWVGPFLLERRDPLLADLTLDGVVWGAVDGPLPGLPLILAGEQALMSVEERDQRTRVHLNLDPARTNLTDSPDWPILMANVIEHTRARLPGPRQVQVHVGETMEYRTSDDDVVADFQMLDPAGTVLPTRGRRVLTWWADRPGVYRLTVDDRPVADFAAQFVDPAESDLTERGEGDREATDDGSTHDGDPAGTGRLEQQLLALLILLLAVADWFVLGRSS